jgi:hypothetical protein
MELPVIFLDFLDDRSVVCPERFKSSRQRCFEERVIV